MQCCVYLNNQFLFSTAMVLFVLSESFILGGEENSKYQFWKYRYVNVLSLLNILWDGWGLDLRLVAEKEKEKERNWEFLFLFFVILCCKEGNWRLLINKMKKEKREREREGNWRLFLFSFWNHFWGIILCWNKLRPWLS